MHALKTGALIRAALAMGGIAAGATEEQLAALDEYGTHIGLAFQVVDDILDVEGDTATLGKTQGKDGEANKPTYVKLMGLEGAKAEAQRLLQAALAALEDFGESRITCGTWRGISWNGIGSQIGGSWRVDPIRRGSSNPPCRANLAPQTNAPASPPWSSGTSRCADCCRCAGRYARPPPRHAPPGRPLCGGYWSSSVPP